MQTDPAEFNGICDFCQRAGSKASRNSDYKGITLLSPEGLWICEKCLHDKSSKIVLGADPDTIPRKTLINALIPILSILGLSWISMIK